MAKTKKPSAAAETETKPQAVKAKSGGAIVAPGASLADAFAQSAAFFGKKATYAVPEEAKPEPVTEAEPAAPTPAAPLKRVKPRKLDANGEKKPKTKKDKKRKLEQTEGAEKATEGTEAAQNSAESKEAGHDAAAAAAAAATPAEASGDKSDRTVFVGNVSLDATQSALKQFFSSCGKIESVRLRFLPIAGTAVNDHGNQKLMMKVCANQKIFTDKRDFCHAYVTFASKESVEKALQKNRSLFMSKTLRIDHENPVVDPQRSVFVGNLSFHITDEAVWSFFDMQLKTDEEKFPVENVRVIRDRETGAGKGFGYVLLKGKALAAKALSLAGKKLENRELRVQVCGKRTKNKQGEDTKLKHEGRRASGAAGRIVTKRKALGEVEPAAPKKAKLTEKSKEKKPRTGSAPAGGKKPFVKKGGAAAAGSVGKGKKFSGSDNKAGAKGKKVAAAAKAPRVKVVKPKHAARKARQAAEAAAAKSKK